MRFQKKCLVLAAMITAAGGISSATFAQEAKIVVKTADDLPRHTYTIVGSATDVLNSEEKFKALLDAVIANCEADLRKYDIQDPTTLQGYYQVLQTGALFNGDYDATLSYADKIKSLEAKDSKKMMSGATIRSYIKARKSGKTGADFDDAFAAELQDFVSALPWDKVGDQIKQSRAQSRMMSKDIMIGGIQMQLDPIIAQQNGVISSEIANGLISAKVAMDKLLPLMPGVDKAYTAVIDANTVAKKDIWAARDIALDAAKGSPVVVCAWDSGTDVSIFEKQLWTNAAEKVNGQDDDGNGFVDDINGIAWNLEGYPDVSLLHSMKDLVNPLELVESHMKGMMDLQSGIASKEAESIQAYMKSLKPGDIKPFSEDMSLYGNYSHGTHVAGIMLSGNPHARLLVSRITFDYRSIPSIPPSVELAQRGAESAKQTVEYFKKAGVRVVNMSWGGSRSGIESALEATGQGKDAAERAALARKLFDIEKKGLEDAMKSAPEILFIAAAGNSDNNIEFSEMIPSGIKIPNLITVGAVDQAGKPTSFTSFGAGVGLYASGFEVDSYVPGGKRMKFSGTSMAAPQVANLAAKLLSVNPSLTVDQLIQAIKDGGDPLNNDPDRLLINTRKSLELVSK